MIKNIILTVLLIGVVSGISDILRMSIQRDYDHSVVEESLRFFVIGDWGGSSNPPYTTLREISVAHQLEKLSDAFQPHFLLALGDNFYEDGVNNLKDKRFEETFNKVFNQSARSRYPWYVVAGNHDWHSNVSAQIAYSKVNPRWHFPNYSYAVSYEFGSLDSAKIGIIMIDTVVLCGNILSDFVDSEPKSPADLKLAEDTWKFIEDQIVAFKKYEYVLIAGHYPIWSIAEHGPTKCLVDRLLPLIDKYGVSAYMSGHDHNLQHIKTENSSGKPGGEFFVSGAANYKNESTKHKHEIPQGSLKFFWSPPDERGGIAMVRATSNGLNVTFVDSFGQFLYSHVVKPRNTTNYQL